MTLAEQIITAVIGGVLIVAIVTAISIAPVWIGGGLCVVIAASLVAELVMRKEEE